MQPKGTADAAAASAGASTFFMKPLCFFKLCYDASDALCSLLSRGTYTQVYV